MELNDRRIMWVPGDTVIINEGEVNLDMYKIVEGNVELYTGYKTDQEVLIGILGPQACFGEFGLLLKKPAIYTAVSYSDLYLLRVTEDELGDFVSQNHDDIVNIMRNMARMMMTMQRQIELLSEDVKELGGKVESGTVKQMLRCYTLKDEMPYKVGMSGKMHFINRS
ncbi:MAG: Crp/Fnr family transcriptional regulator [Lachnospiraceae bacterium]|nr:Crp/Fnr family transcriptional regulator [Lachnospiraceae bacterium]